MTYTARERPEWQGKTYTARERPEWQGKTPDSMPTQAVFLRLYAKQNGLCACGCGRVMNLNRDRVVRDHKVPLRDGGLNTEGNLQLMLEEHHIPKTVEENIARAESNGWQAKAFPELRERKSGFATNRDGKWKKKMNGAVVSRPMRERS
jgi:5-methylcytosine-specific restriction endonuclease McrA